MLRPRPRRGRLLLVGLPVFAVFAAFGAIVWLAYEHGPQVSPVGEPPLIKAPALAIKLPADEAGPSTAEDGGEVRDLLTDTPPADQLERLLPPPEEPQAPVATAEGAKPDSARNGTAATPSPPAGTGSAATGEPPLPQVAQTPPTQTPTAQTPPVQTPPAQTPPAQTPPAQTPPVRTSPLPAPAPATVATAPPEPPREAPLAVERQSTNQAGAERSSSAPQPTPKEAEAALNALLAEVTGPSASGSPAPVVGQPVPTVPSARSEPRATVTPTAAQPAPEPTAPASVSPYTRPGVSVTEIPPDRPSSGQTNGAAAATATAAITPRPSATPVLDPGPNGAPVAGLEGGYRIQLAAVREEADARRAWDLFLVDLGSVLSGVQPIIERAETTNGVFDRVQIGPFTNQPQAESLCDELKRRNASCFVIRR